MKKLNMGDEDIEKMYLGLPRPGDKLYFHEEYLENKTMNRIVERYIIENNGKK